jgi:hypothetical protein
MDLPKEKRVIDHVFYKTVINEIRRFHNEHHHFDETSYTFKVYRKLKIILNSFKPIKITRILTAEQHPAINVARTSIGAAEYLKYTLENYFLRITTYKDVTLEFVATVYQWDIKPGSGFQNRLQKKANAEGDNHVAIIITRVTILMTHVSRIRNLIAHEGSIASEIDILGNIPSVDEIMPDISTDKETRNAFFKKLIDENLKEMLQIEETLATDLLIVLDTLFPIFKEKAGL